MIAHLSDLHFGRINTAVARSLLHDLKSFPLSLVAVSGDLTQNAYVGEFRRARAFLDQIDVPLLVVPGNHDVPSWNLWERFTSPFGRFRKWIEPKRYPTFSHASFAAIGFNSARSFGFYLDWSRGRVSQEQLTQVAKFFGQASQDQLRIVVSHHPLLRPEKDPKARLIGRASLAIKAFSDLGVDVVLGGHLHKSYFGPLLSDEEKELPRPLIVVQASTSTSDRTKNEPNAYNLIACDRNRIAVTTRAWGPGNGFHTVRTADYKRQSMGWEQSESESSVKLATN